MTSTQINFILNEIGGYESDQLIDLVEVSEIILTSNENLYPESSTRYYFDSVNEILYVWDGHMEGENFIVDPKPRFCIEYGQIEGFMMNTIFYRKAPYRMGAQV